MQYSRQQLALLDTSVSADTPDVFRIAHVGEKDPNNGSVWVSRGREADPYKETTLPAGGTGELVYASSCNFFPGRDSEKHLRKSAWAMEQSKAVHYGGGTRHVQDNSKPVVRERNRRRKAHAHAIKEEPRCFFRRKMKEPPGESATHNVKTKKDIGHLANTYSWPTKREQKSPPPGAYPKWPKQVLSAKDRLNLGWGPGHARSPANTAAARKHRTKMRSTRSNQRDDAFDPWGTSASSSSPQMTVESRLETYIDQDINKSIRSSTQMGKTWHDTRMLRNAVERDHGMRMSFCRSAKKEELEEARDIEQRLDNFESRFKKLAIDSNKTLYADD
jgi:hypothetical protein